MHSFFYSVLHFSFIFLAIARNCSILTFQETIHHMAKWKSKVLVSGAAGFIGSHVADFCLTILQFDVVGVDDLSGGFVRNVEKFRKKGGIFVRGDLKDASFVKDVFRSRAIGGWSQMFPGQRG